MLTIGEKLKQTYHAPTIFKVELEKSFDSAMDAGRLAEFNYDLEFSLTNSGHLDLKISVRQIALAPLWHPVSTFHPAAKEFLNDVRDLALAKMQWILTAPHYRKATDKIHAVGVVATFEDSLINRDRRLQENAPLRRSLAV